MPPGTPSDACAPAAAGRGRWRTLPGWALAALLLCGAHAASAEVRWGLGRWQGDGTFALDWEKQDDQRSQSKYETILFQERLRLRNAGAFIFDPRILTLDLGGSFGQSQEQDMSGGDQPLRVGNGTLHDYAFSGLFLSDTSYPATLFATRSETILSQGFGGRSDISFESRGGTFELREGNFLKDHWLPNFTSLLDVRQESLKEDSSVFGSPFQRDERHNIVNYRGHNGWETSDLDLRYELNDVTDPLNPSNVFDSHTVRATHSIDFGPTLNRRFDSTVYYFLRNGAGSGSYLSVDEGLQLNHLRDFVTNYRYNFSQSDSDTGTTTTNGGSAGLLRRFYRTLTATVDAQAVQQNFPTGDKRIYGGQTGGDYRRALPWSGEFFASTSVGYQVDENNFTSSHIDVIDEPHTAPADFGAGSGFTLNNSFVEIDPATNCLAGAASGVVDVRGGARLTATCNLDYVLSQEGSVTRIIPQPGSPVLRPNDPLEVSYTYAVDPNIKYSTASLDARTGVDFPWGGASYEHILSDQSRLSGQSTPQFLVTQNLDRFKVEVRRQRDGLRAQSTLAYEILHSTIVDSNALRLGQQLAYQPRFEINAQISGDEYFVDYPGQARRSESYLARASVDWTPPMGFTVTPFAGYRTFHDSDIPSDEIVEAGVRMRWTYRNLEFFPSFTWTDYRSKLNDVRGEFRIIRHFF